MPRIPGTQELLTIGVSFEILLVYVGRNSDFDVVYEAEVGAVARNEAIYPSSEALADEMCFVSYFCSYRKKIIATFNFPLQSRSIK